MSLIRRQSFSKLPDGINQDVSTQAPLPVDGDRVYSPDVWEAESDIGDFSGNVTDLFDNLHTVSVDSTSNNPKDLLIHFNESVIPYAIGIGAFSGDFSNTEIILITSGGVEVQLADFSTDSTKRTTLTIIPDTIEGANAIKFRFHTADTVSVSNIFILKTMASLSRIQGATPAGDVVTFAATENGNFKVSVEEYGDTPSIDAFARLRVSENFTIFDSKQLHDKQILFWDESLGGSATSTHNSVNAATELRLTASASDYAIRQTKQRFNYQPGKSQLILMTFYSPQHTGATNRIGCFDGTGVNNMTPNNGIFFESDGDVSWNIAKNGTTTETVLQANWNVDPLDGTGSSGVTLDLESTLIAIIDFEWLGVGRVRVGFVIDGIIRYCHYFNHANDSTFTSVYMSTPNLPLRYDSQTDGTTIAELDHICSTVISEGGIEKTGVLRAIDSGNALISSYGTGNSYALLGIRLKSAYLDVTVIPEAVAIVAGTSDSFKWTLELNPTVAGTFTYNDLADSSVQYAVGDLTNTISAAGLVVGAGGGSAATRESSEELRTALRIGSTIAGVRDELVLVLRPLTNNLSQWSTINFRELL